MKRKIITGVLLAMCLMNAGCMRSIKDDNYISDDLDVETERTLTQEQIDLLCRISVNEDAVREGRLKSWQTDSLI